MKPLKPILISGTFVLITWIFLGDDVVFKFKGWLIEKLIYHAHKNTLAFIAILGVTALIILFCTESKRNKKLKILFDDLEAKWEEEEKLREKVRENINAKLNN